MFYFRIINSESFVKNMYVITACCNVAVLYYVVRKCQLLVRLAATFFRTTEADNKSVAAADAGSQKVSLRFLGT